MMETKMIPLQQRISKQPTLCKLIATVIWDAEGILLVDFLPRGEKINAAPCCNTQD
jgi:hypothetical protein